MPDSAEMPAPVSTATRFAAASRSTSSCGMTTLTRHLGNGP
jgi:hypothetical protein